MKALFFISHPESLTKDSNFYLEYLFNYHVDKGSFMPAILSNSYLLILSSFCGVATGVRFLVFLAKFLLLQFDQLVNSFFG